MMYDSHERPAAWADTEALGGLDPVSVVRGPVGVVGVGLRYVLCGGLGQLLF